MSNPLIKPESLPWMMPYLMVKDVAESIASYKAAFGFELGTKPHINEQGKVLHAELRYKDQVIMLGDQNAWEGSAKCPAQSNTPSPINLYFYCDDVDGFHDHAVATGMISKSAPEDAFWGDRTCSLIDQNGYIWCFATHINVDQPETVVSD